MERIISLLDAKRNSPRGFKWLCVFDADKMLAHKTVLKPQPYCPANIVITFMVFHARKNIYVYVCKYVNIYVSNGGHPHDLRPTS